MDWEQCKNANVLYFSGPIPKINNIPLDVNCGLLQGNIGKKANEESILEYIPKKNSMTEKKMETDFLSIKEQLVVNF